MNEQCNRTDVGKPRSTGQDCSHLEAGIDATISHDVTLSPSEVPGATESGQS
jgi:hypothetical protein